MALSNTYIIIVAAGSGSRFGGDLPKQFCTMAGRPVLMHTIDNLRLAREGAELILVLSESGAEIWRELCSRYDFDSPTIVPGGATRWESVRNGLQAIPADAAPHSTVLIHDGARPLIDKATVSRVCGATLNTDGAIPVVPVSDSLRQLDDDEISSEPVDRSRFRAVQTPQGFSLWRLREAYTLPYEDSFTDDASVLAAAGFHNITLVKGSVDNIKITNPRDILFAEAILASRNPEK